MVLFLGTASSDAIVDAMIAGQIGLIDTPASSGRKRVTRAKAGGAAWCADNGAFSQRWDPETWWTWLNKPEQIDNAATCLFAVAPDVVGDAEATWKVAEPWLDRIRGLGYPVAYAAQNGLTELPWGRFDVLFIGGTTEWKLGPEARGWAAEAVARGVPVHMGRVSSEKRYAYARAIGCQTVDGTFLRFGPDVRLPEVLRWRRLTEQPYLI